jgi:hypothetical protein
MATGSPPKTANAAGTTLNLILHSHWCLRTISGVFASSVHRGRRSVSLFHVKHPRMVNHRDSLLHDEDALSVIEMFAESLEPHRPSALHGLWVLAINQRC